MDLTQLAVTAIKIVSILVVLYVFEMTKAVASTLQGDDLPKRNGMLTPNIFKYFEPIGFLLTFFYGYGWGKPAPVGSRNYKDKKAGTLITFLSPIVLSVLLAVVLNIAAGVMENMIKGDTVSVMVLMYLRFFLVFVSQYFLRIAVFNLIPIPPMCGYDIIKCFLSPNAAFQYGQNAPLIQMGFLFLWFFGLITPVLDTVTTAVSSVLLG